MLNTLFNETPEFVQRFGTMQGVKSNGANEVVSLPPGSFGRRNSSNAPFAFKSANDASKGGSAMPPGVLRTGSFRTQLAAKTAKSNDTLAADSARGHRPDQKPGKLSPPPGAFPVTTDNLTRLGDPNREDVSAEITSLRERHKQNHQKGPVEDLSRRRQLARSEGARSTARQIFQLQRELRHYRKEAEKMTQEQIKQHYRDMEHTKIEGWRMEVKEHYHEALIQHKFGFDSVAQRASPMGRLEPQERNVVAPEYWHQGGGPIVQQPHGEGSTGGEDAAEANKDGAHHTGKAQAHGKGKKKKKTTTPRSPKMSYRARMREKHDVAKAAAEAAIKRKNMLRKSGSGGRMSPKGGRRKLRLMTKKVRLPKAPSASEPGRHEQAALANVEAMHRFYQQEADAGWSGGGTAWARKVEGMIREAEAAVIPCRQRDAAEYKETCREILAKNKHDEVLRARAKKADLVKSDAAYRYRLKMASLERRSSLERVQQLQIMDLEKQLSSVTAEMDTLQQEEESRQGSRKHLFQNVHATKVGAAMAKARGVALDDPTAVTHEDLLEHHKRIGQLKLRRGHGSKLNVGRPSGFGRKLRVESEESTEDGRRPQRPSTATVGGVDTTMSSSSSSPRRSTAGGSSVSSRASTSSTSSLRERPGLGSYGDGAASASSSEEHNAHVSYIRDKMSTTIHDLLHWDETTARLEASAAKEADTFTTQGLTKEKELEEEESRIRTLAACEAKALMSGTLMGEARSVPRAISRETRPDGSVDMRDFLWRIFSFYTITRDPLRVLLCQRHDFTKILRDARVIPDPSYPPSEARRTKEARGTWVEGEPLSTRHADLAYTRTIFYQRQVQQDVHGGKAYMTFDGFIYALGIIAHMVYNNACAGNKTDSLFALYSQHFLCEPTIRRRIVVRPENLARTPQVKRCRSRIKRGLGHLFAHFACDGVTLMRNTQGAKSMFGGPSGHGSAEAVEEKRRQQELERVKRDKRIQALMPSAESFRSLGADVDGLDEEQLKEKEAALEKSMKTQMEQLKHSVLNPDALTKAEREALSLYMQDELNSYLLSPTQMIAFADTLGLFKIGLTARQVMEMFIDSVEKCPHKDDDFGCSWDEFWEAILRIALKYVEIMKLEIHEHAALGMVNAVEMLTLHFYEVLIAKQTELLFSGSRGGGRKYHIWAAMTYLQEDLADRLEVVWNRLRL